VASALPSPDRRRPTGATRVPRAAPSGSTVSSRSDMKRGRAGDVEESVLVRAALTHLEEA